MKGMIRGIMSRLQIMKCVDIGDAAVSERSAVYRRKASAYSMFPQETVLTEKLPQNAAGDIGRHYIGLQNIDSVILPIMRERLLIVLRYQQKKVKRLLKL